MHMYSTWMHTLQYFYLTNIESNEWFFVQLLNIASVYAVIREFHSGEFQWQVSACRWTLMFFLCKTGFDPSAHPCLHATHGPMQDLGRVSTTPESWR